ncbi:enolase C-terminal domain-like protein [Mariannaea sp. PMI_226]|nr:enolase C-terminal domain-like protein [Mariannaea sp. PMI_226]
MEELKIAKIDVYQVDLPYSGGVYRLSGGREYRSFDATIVRITTDTGIEGWGESTPFGSNYVAAHALGVRAGIAEIAPWLIGLDPRRVDRINDAMDAALLGHEHAKTAIDVACWDIFGKSVGLPVCELLGGRTNIGLPIISSIYMGDPDDMRARVADHRARGYIGHSVKIGGEPADDAARITAALADKQPGEFFIVDANGGMTVESALHDAAEGFGIKVSKNGGLTKSRRHRDIAVAAGYTMSVQDTTGSDIAFAAIVHLGQTVPERNLRCVLECRDVVKGKLADGSFEVKNGHVVAPNLPGLGITPRMDALGKPVVSYQ